MADPRKRTVQVRRTEPGRFAVTNDRGGQIMFGMGSDTDFTPTELLLAAIGGCTAIDVDILTSRRSQPDSFDVTASADKIRDEQGNRLADIEVTFVLRFPDDEAGDTARAVLPEAVQRSHDRLCTVGRTVEVGTPITAGIA
jgi:putative redox protein